MQLQIQLLVLIQEIQQHHVKHLFTGEATKRAARKLLDALSYQTLENLDGQEFYGEFRGITDKMNSIKQNPVSHVAYGYATQVVILNDEGKIA